MTNIKFGPAGLGGVNEAISNLEIFHKLGLTACEIAFTYGIYIKNEKEKEEIGKKAKELKIKLSIHAPYYINLNSKEKAKVEASKQRILKSCEIGHYLQAYRVVFHPGYYAGMDKEETYQNIKNAIIEIQQEIKKNKWEIKLAPETTGKVNVFGSLEEIKRLVDETKSSFCIDFAHILAREKKVDYNKIKQLFNDEENWHCHFSGIEYGEKGERKHIRTTKENWENLLKELPKNKEIIIINESPYCVEDSVGGSKLV